MAGKVKCSSGYFKKCGTPDECARYGRCWLSGFGGGLYIDHTEPKSYMTTEQLREKLRELGFTEYFYDKFHNPGVTEFDLAYRNHE